MGGFTWSLATEPALPRPDRVFTHPVGAPTCTVGFLISTSLCDIHPLPHDLQQMVIIALRGLRHERLAFVVGDAGLPQRAADLTEHRQGVAIGAGEWHGHVGILRDHRHLLSCGGAGDAYRLLSRLRDGYPMPTTSRAPEKFIYF